MAGMAESRIDVSDRDIRPRYLVQHQVLRAKQKPRPDEDRGSCFKKAVHCVLDDLNQAPYRMRLYWTLV